MGMLKEFKEFAMRGNVIDMAVGIIIGAAFGKIVSSAVNDLIMPPIGMALKGVKFTDLKYTLTPAVMEGEKVVKEAVTVNYGNFIQVTVDFLIVAFVIFMVIKLMNSMKKKEVAPATPPPPSEEVTLLREIRDSLKK